MLAIFLGGLLAVRTRGALRLGEVLMVDVPASPQTRVDKFVHRKHHEAVTGGVSWGA